MGAEDYARVHAETREQWRAWLAEHHADERGAWLVSWKKATGKPAVGYDASVEEALCFGWIDSLQRGVDDERTRLMFTPRKPKSRWSRSNKERVAKLERAGLLEPPGRAVIEEAKRNGAWSALDDVEKLVVPPDLRAAFAEHPGAAGEWEGFPRSVRRGILEWILDAKKPETRAKRIAETASKAARGERANQWNRP